MPKLFAATIALFLLLSAGYGLTQAARSIPWDCSDWQAFAHDDRPTAILESLAENRGKTLYCGIDQSDTFSKAETWAAGKDRNERDDTVYWGERGSFRGFIAAQEGWLTEGESGITGQSIAVIFEFPKAEKRRVKRTKRFDVGTDPDQFPITAAASCAESRGLLCSGWGGWSGYTNTASDRQRSARHLQSSISGSSSINWDMDWRTSALTRRSGQTRTAAGLGSVTPAQWTAMAAAAAERACRSRGARYVAGSADFDRGHNDNRGSDLVWHGDNLGWFFAEEEHDTNLGNFRARARQSRTWSATCKKVIRRSR